jgi:predicted alpha/beta-fold hydrolase
LYSYRNTFCKETPSLTFEKTEFNTKLVEACKLLQSEYKYPLWGSNGHLQTLYAAGGRRHFRPAYAREELTCEDGGIVVLDWANKNFDSSTPTIVIVPGVCSHSDSHYVRSWVENVTTAGFRAVVFNPRGCVTIKTPKLFTPGGTSDLKLAMQHIHASFPESPLFGIGLSMGANLLMKYVGEASVHPEIQYFKGVVSISQGYDGLKGIRYLKSSPFYDRHVTSKLVDLVKRHSEVFEEVVDLSFVYQVNSVEDFDMHFTKKIHKFEDIEEYYRKESCIHNLHQVSIPTLLLNALDDPLIAPELIPYHIARENKNIILATTAHGGHISWAEGYFLPNRVHWHERVAFEYIGALLTLDDS